MKNTSLTLIILFTLFFLIVGQNAVKALEPTPQEEETGLIGVFFDHSDFKRPVKIWKTLSVNSSEMDWPKHNDFSVQWQGSIEAPIDGPVSFFTEANDGIKLEINEKVVIDSWDKKIGDKGNVDMKAGSWYSIRLQYRQITKPSFMRLFWSWQGKEKALVPANALHFSSEDKAEMKSLFRRDVDLLSEKLSFDIPSILSVNNEEDVKKHRIELIDFLFGDVGMPQGKAIDIIDDDIKDDNFNKLPNLKVIKKLTMNMDFGLNSIVYHFVPIKSNNKAVIYHQGHNGKFSLGITTISGLLSKGYHVVGMSMPLKGMNSVPLVDLKRFGKMNMNSHGRMGFLNPKHGHPVKYFLEPVFRVVNYLKEQGFNEVHMTGISGGGWTTTLCAAIDTRIRYSYPVAGSLPIYLRIIDPKDGSWGDYEQVVPELYRISNYLDLYVLGSTGRGRRQIQILNEFDSCCFSGTGYTSYEDIVIQSVIDLGSGSFEVFLDSSHEEHKISEIVLDYILNDLEK